MKTPDFALAPSGAFFFDPNANLYPWARNVDWITGSCFWWDGKVKDWVEGCVSDVKLIPIPPHEIEINRLADSNIVVDGECDTYGEFDITGGDINERRRQRLEAGLTSDNHGNSSEIPNSSEQPSDEWEKAEFIALMIEKCDEMTASWLEALANAKRKSEQQKAERELKQLKEKIYAGHIAPGKPKMREEMVSDIVDLLSNGLAGYRLVKEGE